LPAWWGSKGHRAKQKERILHPCKGGVLGPWEARAPECGGQDNIAPTGIEDSDTNNVRDRKIENSLLIGPVDWTNQSAGKLEQ